RPPETFTLSLHDALPILLDKCSLCERLGTLPSMPGFEDGFLGVPARPGEPRSSGLTHVIDKGLNLREIEGLFDTAGAFVDIVKRSEEHTSELQSLTNLVC